MNNNSAEWQREFYLTHDKYRMQRQGTDCYKVVKDLTRILQLPTIAKLTTDNESVISDFRLNSGEYGLEPYDEYAIKVDDTYGASLYILVHRRADTTFLCPILVGFEGENTCAMVMPTDNWRMREMATFVELRRAEKEFGVAGLMMAVNTRNGVYGCLSVLNESDNLLERWLRTERDSLHIRNSVTAPSSAALILQIWLHTICLWKRRCLSRKVEQRIVHANGEQESVKDVRECLNTSKQTIVDLKKGIVVYVNDSAGKHAFAGFCVLQSERCGHFRHLQSGRVVYVRPTTVHYKKLNPNKAISQTAKPVIYRNTEEIKGAFQLSMPVSFDPVNIIPMTITRCCVSSDAERIGAEKDSKKKNVNTDEGGESRKNPKDRMMGRRSFVEYGLYHMSIQINSMMAQRNGITMDDVNLLIDALQHMFENDMSSGRALTLRKLIVVEHTKPMGNVPRDTIENALTATLKIPDDCPTSYNDYIVTFHRNLLPKEVKVTEYGIDGSSKVML